MLMSGGFKADVASAGMRAYSNCSSHRIRHPINANCNSLTSFASPQRRFVTSSHRFRLTASVDSSVWESLGARLCRTLEHKCPPRFSHTNYASLGCVQVGDDDEQRLIARIARIAHRSIDGGAAGARCGVVLRASRRVLYHFKTLSHAHRTTMTTTTTNAAHSLSLTLHVCLLWRAHTPRQCVFLPCDDDDVE